MLRLRVATAAVLIPVLVAVLLAGRPWFLLLIGLLAAVAAWETARLLQAARQPAELGAVVAIALGMVAGAALWPDRPEVAPLFIGAALLIAALAGFLRPDAGDGFAVWVATAFGGVYAGLLSFLAWIAAPTSPLPPTARLAPWLDQGGAWLLTLVLTVWAYDTAAYLVGRTWGRGRLLAHISPRKTWSGAAAGACGAVAASAACLAAAGRSPLGGLAAGLVVAIAAQCGDIAESMLKRAAGAKDSGSIIPGHGGLLDRIDSFLFAAPAMYLYLVLTGNG